MCSDTLYVVTGAYYGNASKQATDNNGVKVDVPTHYFKVLLRTKSGVSGKWVNQCDASQLQTIGFWLENKAYSESQPSKAICKKVSEIEQLTGFTFFPGIPQEVKTISMPLNGILTNFYKYETNINAWGIARCIVCVGIRTEKALQSSVLQS